MIRVREERNHLCFVLSLFIRTNVPTVELSKEEIVFGGVLYRARGREYKFLMGRNANAGTNKKKNTKKFKKRNVLLNFYSGRFRRTRKY